MIGASMGGFAAISYAELADAVLAFGPQIELECAPYRPGFDIERIRKASRDLRQAAARRRGSLECHVSMEAHLGQAMLLQPLPSAEEEGPISPAAAGPRDRHLRLVVHPFRGRVARVLERAGLLLPLLGQTLSRLQSEAKVEAEASAALARPASQRGLVEWPRWQVLRESLPEADAANVPAHAEEFGAHPSDDSNQRSCTEVPAAPEVLVGLWHNWTCLRETGAWQPPRLKTLRATQQELRELIQRAPSPGDWFCPSCGFSNFAGKPTCQQCSSFHFLDSETTVTVPGADQPAFRHDDWVCTWCERLEYGCKGKCSWCWQPRCEPAEANLKKRSSSMITG